MNSFSVSRVLRVLGALLLDAAMIILFIEVFSWFSLLAPAKSALMLLVLLIGLLAVNVVIIAPPLHKKVGLAYSAAFGTLLVLYAVVANVVSALSIFSTVLWFIVWQLIILAIFILILAVIAAAAKRHAQDMEAGETERAARGNVMLMLSDMQAALASHATEPALVPVLEAFRALKERINASTPFGRIQGNAAVTDLEYKIMGNLGFLLNELRANLSGENIVRIQTVIEETRRMVMNRETLNIQ